MKKKLIFIFIFTSLIFSQEKFSYIKNSFFLDLKKSKFQDSLIFNFKNLELESSYLLFVEKKFTGSDYFEFHQNSKIIKFKFKPLTDPYNSLKVFDHIYLASFKPKFSKNVTVSIPFEVLYGDFNFNDIVSINEIFSFSLYRIEDNRLVFKESLDVFINLNVKKLLVLTVNDTQYNLDSVDNYFSISLDQENTFYLECSTISDCSKTLYSFDSNDSNCYFNFQNQDISIHNKLLPFRDMNLKKVNLITNSLSPFYDLRCKNLNLNIFKM